MPSETVFPPPAVGESTPPPAPGAFLDPVTQKTLPALHPIQEEFCERIRQWHETEAAACKTVGIHRVVLEEWKKDPEFVRRLRLAKQDAIDEIEAEAIRRAKDGIEKGIYYQGDLCATEQQYSDSLMQFILKGQRQEVYGDKRELNATIRSFSIVDVLVKMKERGHASRTIHQEGEHPQEEAAVGARLRGAEGEGQEQEGGDNVRERSGSQGSSEES